MNELYRTLEDALSAAPPDSDTRELVGQALDILDTIPMESLEMMAKVERVKEVLKAAIRDGHDLTENSHGFRDGLRASLRIVSEEFPDAT